MGIWCISQIDPGCTRARIDAEFQNAVQASPFVDGYVVGNEGLGERYTRAELEAAMASLKAATGKPVTTSEQLDDYITDSSLLALGDFVFPNVHPFWHGIRDPEKAAQWTADQYKLLKDLLREKGVPGKPVLFKEVGLPTAGCPECSQENQDRYYQRLRILRSGGLLLFSYFEAYDQPWKTSQPVESHWGLLGADRSPKLALGLARLTLNLMGCTACGPRATLRLSVAVGPGATPRTVDAYVAIRIPDGTLLFYPSFTRDLQPIVTNWNVAPFTGEVFRYTFNGVEPAGSYAWLAAFTEPGTLTFIGPIVSAPFTVSP